MGSTARVDATEKTKVMYVWPCIIYENDEKYRLDATIVINYHKYLYMFRTKCPSSGVQVVCYCIWCSALGVVAMVLRSRCVVLCTVCKFVSGYILNTQCTRCPKHVEIFVIINQNFCIKLVPLVKTKVSDLVRKRNPIRRPFSVRTIYFEIRLSKRPGDI